MTIVDNHIHPDLVNLLILTCRWLQRPPAFETDLQRGSPQWLINLRQMLETSTNQP